MNRSPYYKSCHFEFLLGDLDPDQILDNAIEDFKMSCKKIVNEQPPHQGEYHASIMVTEHSTQALHFFVNRNFLASLVVPLFATREEIALAFKILRNVENDFENHQLSLLDKPFSPTTEAEREMWEIHFNHLKQIVCEPEITTIIGGAIRRFAITESFIRQKYAEMDAHSLTNCIFDDFAQLQYAYMEYEPFNTGNARRDDSDETFNFAIISNRDGYGEAAEKVAIDCENAIKVADFFNFWDAARDNRYITFFDPNQFAINEMPEEEWQELYDSIQGEVLNKPKTYILRWNPAISSYTLARYCEAVLEYGDSFSMNWSIYEYQDAKKGDLFYMLREGDGENPGIVFRGVFASDPYEGDDWAGSDRKRYYVDIDCMDAISPFDPPHITDEELTAAIPEINWQRGHSGQLITPQQADKLSELWDRHHPKD